jgi:hypothetical protein
LKHCGFCSPCGCLINALCSCCPCNGCSGEIYWSEWHNDPPYCHDPCNNCGQWIGPGSGGIYGAGCNPACGCNGGCSGGACGCDGGYSSVPAAPTQGGGQVASQRRPAHRTITANNARPQQSTTQTAQSGHSRAPYASQRPAAQSQTRSASRTMAGRGTSYNGNTANNSQAKPILW